MNTFRFAILYRGLEQERPAIVEWYSATEEQAVQAICRDPEVTSIRTLRRFDGGCE